MIANENRIAIYHADFINRYELLQFTNQIGFFLATAVEADRNGNLYLDKVQPDEQVVGGDNFDDLKKDKKIKAALKWLQWKRPLL